MNKIKPKVRRKKPVRPYYKKGDKVRALPKKRKKAPRGGK